VQFLILSDLHANWFALEAVLANAEGKYQKINCCGDLVGYNPHPQRVVEWTQSHSALTVRGNHDKVVAGIESLDWFNEVAQTAARWTIQQLQSAELEYLRGLPKGPAAVTRTCKAASFRSTAGSGLLRRFLKKKRNTRLSWSPTRFI
jgi:hypothetical protein